MNEANKFLLEIKKKHVAQSMEILLLKISFFSHARIQGRKNSIQTKSNLNVLSGHIFIMKNKQS